MFTGETRTDVIGPTAKPPDGGPRVMNWQRSGRLPLKHSVTSCWALIDETAPVRLMS